MPAMNGRQVFRIGNWNVKSLKNKENEVIREMERYNLDILGLSETKVRGNGMREINGTKYVYAGATEGKAKGGVGLIVPERWADRLRSWRCVSERCVTIRLRIEGQWISIIQVYAPTDDKDGGIKDAFLEELQGAVDKVPRGDKLTVMGDFNARVGNKAELWKGVIGKHGEEVENDSGRRLLSFCAENEMQVMNTQYDHKRIHKFTWTCPGRGLKSIIDYFLVRGDLRKEVHDVKVIQGAEIGSDHHLVLMKVIICERSKMKRKERSCQLRSKRL